MTVLLLTALFVLFCGRCTVELLLVGFGLALLLRLLSARLLRFSLQKEIHLFRQLIPLLQWGLFLFGQILVSNLSMIRWIVTPRREREACVVTMQLGLHSRALQTAFANAVTLTPGTLSVSLAEGSLTVHAWDKSLVRDLAQSPLLLRLRQLEERQGEKHALENLGDDSLYCGPVPDRVPDFD